MALRIIHRDSKFEMFPGGEQLTHVIRTCPQSVVREYQKPRIVIARGPLHKFFGKFKGRAKFASQKVNGPQVRTMHGERLAGRPAFAKFTCSEERSLHIWSCQTFDGMSAWPRANCSRNSR